MSETSRTEALQVARKHVRSMPGAPDERQVAQRIFADLTGAHGWTPSQQQQIVAFGAWLQSRPDLAQLRHRCRSLTAKLGE